MPKFLSFALLAFAFFNPVSAQARVELTDLVVGFDRAERDYVFPLRVIQGHGELYLEPVNVRISPNCKGFITVEDRKVWCSPRGDRSRKFVFARFRHSHPESDSSWVAHFLAWDLRVRLRVVDDVPYLDIREN